MSKRAIFHPEAETEFLAAVAYYAERNPNVADRFVAEIQRLVTRIEIQPGRYGPWRHGTRRARTLRYPYLIVFAERAQAIHILAVAHVRQHPDYWQTRAS